jgi:hypothetical protein
MNLQALMYREERMKRLLLVVGAFIFSAHCFAITTSSTLGKSFSSAFKNQHSMPVKSGSNLMMVYGGQDISHKPTLDTSGAA